VIRLTTGTEVTRKTPGRMKKMVEKITSLITNAKQRTIPMVKPRKSKLRVKSEPPGSKETQ
jgi:hypothetical protein